MSTVRSVTLNDVAVTENQTHIVIYHEKREDSASTTSSASLDSMKVQIDRLTAELERLSTKVEQLENQKSTPFFGAELSPAPAGLEVRRLSDTFAQMSNIKEVIINLPLNGSASASGSVADEEADEEEAEEEADVAAEAEPADQAKAEPAVEAEAELAEQEVEEGELAEQEEEDELAEQEEDELAEEEEEEALELEEFEYKGVTYYKDSENQVYQKDSDGDLDDTPIGIWNETKQKIQKYAAA